MKTLYLALLSVLIASSAFAADTTTGPGSNAKADSHYTVTKGEDVWILCDGVSNAGAETACQPAAPIDLSDCEKATIEIGKVTEDPGACVTGIFQIYHSNSATIGEPNVWHHIGDLTGIVSPLISEYTLPRRTKSNLRIVIGAGTGTAMADADCDEVDITLTCERPAP